MDGGVTRRFHEDGAAGPASNMPLDRAGGRAGLPGIFV
jgi:hypothetical protein